MVVPLCTVRNCRVPLRREGGSFLCAAGHAFNVARSAYLNLLQPQDRRSREPGDPPEAVRARRRFLDGGYDEPFLARLKELVRERGAARGDPVLDVGCGEGYFLGEVVRDLRLDGHGLDLSATACDLAARRYPSCFFVVANAHRFLPWPDESFSLVLSLAGPRNPAEMRRVLAPGGRLLVAFPAPDDLAELRAAILGEAAERDRAPRVEEELAAQFEAIWRGEVRHGVRLTGAELRDLALATYRLGRPARLERLATLDSLDVTMSRRTIIFSPRSSR